MQKLNLKRFDQHAIVAAVIDGLTMVEIVDGLVGLDFQEKVSTGMVLKAMILNGLGFSNRPLTLPPQFFANRPLESILGLGITAKHFNRHQIGRLLEGLFQYGCTTLFCQISSQAGRLENVERRIQSLDSTSGSTFGADPQSITISYGFCQDHRPGLRPVVVELILAQQGKTPRFIKPHNGKASDSLVFGQPTKALVPGLKESGQIKRGPKMALADPIHQPDPQRTNKREKELTERAVEGPERWSPLSNEYRFQCHRVEHNDIQQAWIVFDSAAARVGLQQTATKRAVKGMAAAKKTILDLCAKDFCGDSEAKGALAQEVKKLKLLRLVDQGVTAIKRDAKRRKPSPQ